MSCGSAEHYSFKANRNIFFSILNWCIVLQIHSSFDQA